MGVGTAMRFWEVLALRGETMLVLPAAVRNLTTLARPLDATVRLYLGKQLDKQSHAARPYRLGAGGAELTSGATLALFSAVQIHLSGLAGPSTAAGVDGKVVGLSEVTAHRRHSRFTGVGWSARDRIEALVRSAE